MKGVNVNLQTVRVRVAPLADVCQREKKLRTVTLEMLVATSRRDDDADPFPSDMYDVGPGSLVALVSAVARTGVADAL